MSARDSLRLPIVDACWSRIGIRGDRTCPKLLEVIHCNNCPVFADAAQALLDRPAPAGYLAELGAFVAEPVAVSTHADQALVLFGVSGEWFAVPSGSVIEATESAPPRGVPHRSNEVFVGLINIRGQLELCMSLRGLLALPTPPPKPSATARVLVIAQDDDRWVLLVDSVEGVRRYHASDLLDAPPASARRNSEYVKGLIVHEGKDFALLDLKRVCESLQEKLG